MMSLDQEALETLRKDGQAPASRYQTRTGQRRRRLLMVGLAVVVAVLAGLLLGRSRPMDVDIVAAAAPLAPGQAAVLNASGYVVARRLATVSSKVTGRVIEVTFEEGSQVREGQDLARLDDATVRAVFSVASRQLDAARLDLKEVEVRLAEAIRDRDRLRLLREQNLVSVSALDGAEANANALAARLETARANVAVAQGNVNLRAQDLDDLVVRAPFDGVVISKDAQPGEMVSPISAGGGYTRTGIATIVDMASREIEVDVNEAYINRVQDRAASGGNPRFLSRLANPGQGHRDRSDGGSAEGDCARADRDRRTGPPHPAGHGGQGAILRRSCPRRVPRRLPACRQGPILGEEGANYVWRVIDGRAVRTNVEVGEESEGNRQVLKGVAVGDEVIVGPPAGISDGGRVRGRSEA